MQLITGKLAMAGQGYILSFVEFQIHERMGSLAGNIVATASTDVNGAFSFSLRPGTYFMRYGSDSLPIRVKETSGTATIDQIAETV